MLIETKIDASTGAFVCEVNHEELFRISKDILTYLKDDPTWQQFIKNQHFMFFSARGPVKC